MFISRFLSVLAILITLVGIVFMSRLVVPVFAGSYSYDVVVVGGGSGGTMAAVQAARQGVSVAIIEPTDWLGGQMAAAGVSNMDEGGLTERNSGIYKEFVNRIAAKYGGEQYIHKCYFSSSGICPEPKVIRQVLNEMVAETGRITVFYRNNVQAVSQSGSTVTGVTTISTADGLQNTLSAKVVIDATEYGDLLPRARIPYRVGNSTSGNINLNACVQDITYTAVIKKYDAGIPASLKIATSPPGYNSTIESRFAEMVTTSNPRVYTDFTGPPELYRWSFVKHAAYRGMADSARPNTSTVSTEAGAGTLTKTGINFANDYPSERPYFTGNTTLSVRYLEDEGYRKQVNCEAKLKTIQFIYFMQKSGQNWSVADDQGYDTAFNYTENACGNIPAELKEIEKRLPQAPYVREGRRMIGAKTFTGVELRAQKKVDRNNAGAVNAVDFSSSIAIGGYDDDLHNCNADGTYEADLESINEKNMGTAPFQVPFESLIPQSVDGFIAAEKNISQSRLVNGATRLQPITMLTGQAAGYLAAISAQTNRSPRAVKPIEVQKNLLSGNSPLTLYNFSDVTLGSPYWQSIHLASLYGIMIGYNGRFGTLDTINRGDGAVIVARTFEIPFNGSVDDAITQLRSRKIITSSSNAEYNPSGTLTKGDMSLLFARALGFKTFSTEDARNYLSQQQILVSCISSSCLGESVTRGAIAETVAGSLYRLKTGTVLAPPPLDLYDPVGSHDGVNDSSIWGWTCDQDGNGAVTDVHFWADGVTFLGAVTANQAGEAAIGAYCGGSANHRFSFAMPSSMKDGKTHAITAYGIDANGSNHRPLWGSPKSYTSSPPIQSGAPASNLQASVQSNKVSLTWTASSGVYMNTNASDSDHIQVYTNPDFTGTKVLDGGVGGGITAWDIPINTSGSYNSVMPGRTYYARVYSFNAPCNCSNGTSTSFTIPNTTVVTPTPTPSSLGSVYYVGQPTYQTDPTKQKIKGSFDGLTADGKLYGWACDSDNFAAGISVHIYVNGSYGTAGAYAIASGTANMTGESAIGSFCGGTTAHRFFINLPAQFRDGVKRRYYVHGINVNPGPNNLLPWGNGRDIAYRP